MLASSGDGVGESPPWGWVYVDGGMLFHVRPQQAEFAQYLLVEAGVWVQ
ncbi:MAG: hypothetical protein KA314_04620 [Chloroflexi bacterium]|nr:hypothetical protein [Chloroflexota bacterium]